MLGFGVWGLRFRGLGAWDLGFEVFWFGGLGFWCLGIRFLGFRVCCLRNFKGLGFRFWVLGF